MLGEAVGRLLDGAPANWLWEPSVAVSSGGSALMVWAAQATVSEGRLVFSRRFDPVAGWGPVERIDGGEARGLLEIVRVRLGIDAAGNGLALWDSQGLVAARFAVARGWEPPQRLTGPEGRVPVVSVAAAGPAFAAWVSDTLVVRRFDPAEGWGATSRFAADGSWRFSGTGSLVQDEGGRGLVAWTRQRGSFDFSVWSASYESGQWTPWGQLNAASVRASDPLVGLAADGRGVAVWRQEEDAAYARFAYSRGFEVPLTAGAIGGLSDWSLAPRAGGLGILVGGRLDPQIQGRRPQASRYDGTQWSVPEPLEQTALRASTPAVAGDRCGNALVVWSA